LRKPAYYHGWNIILACILSQLAALGVPVNCFSLFVGHWSTQFHTPISTLALGMTAFSLSCSIWCPLVGFLADRYPVRNIMAIALVGMALFQTVIGFASAGWQIVVLYSVVLGLVITFSSGVPSQALVARWFVRRRGLAMGLTSFGIALAGVVFPPIITALLPQIGWRATWLLFGVLTGVVVAPIVFFSLRERPGAEEGAAYVTPTVHDPQAVALPLRRIFGNRNFWMTIIAFTPTQSALMVLSVNLAPIVMSKGFSLATAGLLISVYSLSAIASKLGMGMLADRFGNRIPLMLVTLFCAAGCAALAMGHALVFIYAAVMLIGLGQGAWTILASATAAEFGAQAFGRAFGFISMLTPFATIASPIVAWLYEHHVDYSVSLIGLALFAMLGFVAAAFLKENRPALV
jgi:MFS family permease